MHEATALIDQVLLKQGTPNPSRIQIIFSEDPYLESQADIILDFVEHDGEASIYNDRISGKNVWLCPVLQRMDEFNGTKPKFFYVCIDEVND